MTINEAARNASHLVEFAPLRHNSASLRCTSRGIVTGGVLAMLVAFGESARAATRR